MPDITEMNLSSEKSIFFFDTSCKTDKNGKIEIKPVQACAIESAALANADYNVYLLYLSAGQIKNTDPLSDKLFKTISEYANVKILHLNFQKLVENMKIIHLYYNTLYSTFDSMRAAIKFLVLKKYGGIYLENDVLVIKPFGTLPKNFIGTYANGSITNGVIGWRDKRNDTVSNTHKRILTGTLETMVCNTNKTKCDDFKVFNHEVFYPINESNWELLFNTNKENEKLYKTIMTTSYAVKIYDHLRKNVNISFNSETLYNRLAAKYCPKIFSATKNRINGKA